MIYKDKEYEHVLNIWKKIRMKTIKDYHELYLKCDVWLLADVFEKFRNKSLKNYALSLSHHLSTPDLSWDAMLKMRKNLAWTYSRSSHVYIKRYKIQNF